MKYAKIISAPVPQTEALNSRQVKNNAGGFVFQLDDFARLERFLVLGSDSNTYYQKAPALTRENALAVERCYVADPLRTVRTIVEFSREGRAPKNDPAIFALAIGAVSTNDTARGLALAALPDVCRTGTHLFQFVITARALGRGWGRSFKRAIANWYDNKPVYSLGYQAIKYRQRDGYTHKRLLQTSHPKCADQDPMREALYQWIVGKEADPMLLPPQVAAHIEAMKTTDKSYWVDLIKGYNLPWEALPTEANLEPEVWKAHLPKMGLTALVRNLGNMTRLGAIKPLSKEEKIVVERLHDTEDLKNARIHPFNMLVANKVYRQGRGFRGTNNWTPSQPIVSALEDAFYSTFKFVEPTGKRHFIGLDVSGSMSNPLMDSPLSVAEGAAAMLMTVAKTEPWHQIMGFHHGLTDLKISNKDSLESVLKKTTNVNFGGTDCALPMIYAKENQLTVDIFSVYTDSETYAGRIHPVQALKEYRRASGINAKLVVVGMTSTGFSIADPQDAGCLDVVGFDSNAPAIMAEFARR